MTDFKETVSVQSQSVILTLQEVILSIRNAYKSMPRYLQVLVMFLLIGIIPCYLGVRYGVEKVYAARYARVALLAHPSYTVTQAPKVSAVQLIRNPNETYSAFVEISNQNLELSATDISYAIDFKNAAGETIYRVSDTMYLLPDEKKYIVVPKVDAGDALTTGVLTMGDIAWEKRISIPKVELRVSEPTLLESYNPLTLSAEGSVVNNSPYEIQAVRILFFLYDAQGRVIGVSQRDEFKIPAFSRRAYKQLWPGLYKQNVAKVGVYPYTNAMDPQNVTVEIGALPTPTNDPRDRRPF